MHRHRPLAGRISGSVGTSHTESKPREIQFTARIKQGSLTITALVKPEHVEDYVDQQIPRRKLSFLFEAG